MKGETVHESLWPITAMVVNPLRHRRLLTKKESIIVHHGPLAHEHKKKLSSSSHSKQSYSGKLWWNSKSSGKVFCALSLRKLDRDETERNVPVRRCRCKGQWFWKFLDHDIKGRRGALVQAPDGELHSLQTFQLTISVNETARAEHSSSCCTMGQRSQFS